MKVERTIVIKENEISEEVGQYEKEITKLLAEILMKTENIMVDKSDRIRSRKCFFILFFIRYSTNSY